MEKLLGTISRGSGNAELAAPAIGGRTAQRLPSLIMTRTPLRVSFAGGGTDLPDFYNRDFGAVFSAAVDKYIYVTVKRHSGIFNEPIRLNYSQTEQVNTVEEIKNNIARECLRFLEIEPPIYISTVGDMPASTGMGGSSSFTVGLLNALHAFRGERVTPAQLAEEACHIEMDILEEPIGKQDQYAAAFGGINLFRFHRGGAVTVELQRVRNGAVEHLFRNLMMFWTSHQRPASFVLVEQKAKTFSNIDTLRRMRDQAFQLQDLFSEGAIGIERFGAILHSGWEMKRQLASRVSNIEINRNYDLAMEAGAEGGKLCGAGSGGFLMFAVKPERRDNVRRALSHLAYVPIGYEVHGSCLLHPTQP